MANESILNESVLKGLSVLYVEDDDLLRANLGKYLKRRFGEVFLASNGREGLDIYNRRKPDFVITDINMPVMNGNEMIKSILEVDDAQPIIITTAFNDDEHTSLRCVNLIKPIDTNKLLEAIFYCIGTHLSK
ncbi:response regulator receiver protein [Candidatus Magnetobacterium bavaricum]|uniref:Response regulator receiver protein n=1 Tax=Candidatus Magnetobacterium bavaricum TaxID=29290 RepID=A0A0F3GXE2_9BACT|nr:response regulator receiver protein [Candidatus Magnetobacterium bavaricum]